MQTTCARDECTVIFSVRWKGQKFCSSSCAAKVNNVKFPKRTSVRAKVSTVKYSCKKCGDPVSSKVAIHCIKCYRTIQQEEKQDRIESWLKGTWRGGTDAGLSESIRPYLLKMANYSCSVCGFNERHPDDDSCILEINHINGNGTDHRPENLEVLCPNHHTLTSSYRARNRGYGRPVSYHRRVRVTGFEPA